MTGVPVLRNGDLAKLSNELKAVVTNLGEREMRQRPLDDPFKWSVQQSLEHLLLTYESTVQAIANRLVKGRSTKARVSIQQRFIQTLILDLGWFPTGRLAPDAVTPAKDLPMQSGVELAGRLMTALSCLDEQLTCAEAAFGAKRAVSHMILGPLSMQQWGRFHRIHGEHHLRQVRRVIRQHQI